MKTKIAKNNFTTDPLKDDAAGKKNVNKPAISAKGAVLLAFPFALIFTVLLFLTFDISLLWALPIYALIGSGLILLFMLGSYLANRF